MVTVGGGAGKLSGQESCDTTGRGWQDWAPSNNTGTCRHTHPRRAAQGAVLTPPTVCPSGGGVRAWGLAGHKLNGGRTTATQHGPSPTPKGASCMGMLRLSRVVVVALSAQHGAHAAAEECLACQGAEDTHGRVLQTGLMR